MINLQRKTFSIKPIALAISCMLGVTQVANAQEEAANEPVSEGESWEKIVVLGEKRGRTVQDTVSSVAITSSIDIENNAIDNVFDILKRTAGVSSGGGDLTFSVRGVNSEGQNARGNPLATIYVDGAPLESEAAGKGGPLSMWDVAQVEVFRGPQATTQGRNSLAGAIVVHTQDPDFEWGGKGQVGFGSNGAYRFSTAVGGSLIPDELAFRVALDKNHTDGDVKNVTLGLDDWALEDNALGRVKLLWEPADIEGLSVKFTHNYSKGRFGTENVNLFSDTEESAAIDPFDRLAYSNLRDMTTTTTKNAILEVKYDDLWEGVDIISITSFSDVEQLQLFDQDFTAAGATDGSSVETKNEYQSQEVRFSYDRGGNFTGLLGLYYFSSEESYELINNLDFPLDVSIFPESIQSLVPPSFNLSVLLNEQTDVENYAMFFEGEYRFNDMWRVMFGLRYDNEEQSLDGLNNPVIDDPNLPEFLVPILEPVVAAAIADSPVNTEEYDAFLPSLSLTYSIDEDMSVSASAKRAYRSGGSDFNLARALSVSYDSEYAWTYELAFRSLWADGDITANGNIYYTDWKDQQVSIQPENPINRFDSVTVNAGKSELSGAEFELSAVVNENFDVFASASYSKTEFIEFVSAGLDLSGNEFRFAPTAQIALGGSYSNDGWLISADAAYTSSSYDDARNRPIIDELDSHILINAKVGYEWDSVGVYFVGKNITNEEYVRDASDVTVLLGDSASYNLLLTFEF
ncbi:MAG: TonB-dependent receptor [Paraglaciecola sp.]|uniref:TonB-dependent receptor n=1 Tax=Paraglaciecola sp. TaxID=1920173 RepID=UPI003299F591